MVRKFTRKFVLLAQVTAVLLGMVLVAAISMPNLLRSRIAADRASHWQQSKRIRAAGGFESAPAELPEETRKMTRTAMIDATVDDTSAAAATIQSAVSGLGGYLASSEIASDEQDRHAVLIFRVPATKLDDVRAKIKQLVPRVTNEKVEASDITTQYVDAEATLRNSKAEEARYRQIMAKAVTVKDTIEVAKQLAEVRGRIERQQAQMNVFQSQVELSTISLNLYSSAQIAALHWRPSQTLKASARELAQGIANFFDEFIVILFKLPVILLWILLVGCGLALIWRVMLVLWKRMFRAWVLVDNGQPEVQ